MSRKNGEHLSNIEMLQWRIDETKGRCSCLVVQIHCDFNGRNAHEETTEKIGK